MKSAYELAMERLQAADPTPAGPLTEAQKERLAEIDRRFQAKIAEREIFLNQKLAQARAQRDPKAVQDIEYQLRNERLRLEEEREHEKQKYRDATRGQ